MSIHMKTLRDIAANGWPVCDEVADEIEQLERENRELREALQEITRQYENLRASDALHIDTPSLKQARAALAKVQP